MKNFIFPPRPRTRRFACIVAGALLAVLPVLAQAQDSDFPTIPPALEKKLAARASNVKAVTLNKNMLNFGSQFLNSKQDDDHEAQQFIQGLNGIYVRKYEFDQPGAYTEEDLQTIRKQFLGPQWNPMVQSSEKAKGGEEMDKDVYVKVVHGKVQGMFVLKAEPKELSLVYISGTIDMKDLDKLGGNFGVPNINTGKPTPSEHSK